MKSCSSPTVIMNIDHIFTVWTHFLHSDDPSQLLRGFPHGIPEQGSSHVILELDCPHNVLTMSPPLGSSHTVPMDVPTLSLKCPLTVPSSGLSLSLSPPGSLPDVQTAGGLKCLHTHPGVRGLLGVQPRGMVWFENLRDFPAQTIPWDRLARSLQRDCSAGV